MQEGCEKKLAFSDKISYNKRMHLLDGTAPAFIPNCFDGQKNVIPKNNM